MWYTISQILFVVSLVSVSHACPTGCKLPACFCASTDVPAGLNPKQIPQMVLLTFDDAVQALNYETYYKNIFTADRKNPDGCSITATFFTSHDYTDYSKVHELYSKGHEIALHSITHTAYTDYWRLATVDTLKNEFGGERDLISHFANIPKEELRGMRIPFLQMSGDNSTRMMQEIGLEYDCSWPTRHFTEPGLWPYTLDNPSIQDCPIGPCPRGNTPGIWIQPMIDWIDDKDEPCAMADACVNIPNSVDGIYNFMVKNFEKQYNENRAPVGLYVHAAWMLANPNRFPAYQKFVDYLVKLPDVYIVNIHRALQWVKNPQTLPNLKEVWPTCNAPTQTTCSNLVCKLNKGSEELRYMTQCQDTCPNSYPWLGNPLGI